MRATALAFVLAFAALAQLVAGPLRQATACAGARPGGSGGCCCCVAAHAPAAHDCCGDHRTELPKAPKRRCPCHVDPAPPAPPDAPSTIAEPHLVAALPPPVAFATPLPQAAPGRRLQGVCRPPGPTGPARHVVLCVFLI